MDRLIYNLSTMPDDRRSTISWASMGAGVAIMAFGIFFAHAGFAPDPSPENGFYLEWVPREWYVFTAGQIIALVGSQLLIIGAAFLWVANQPMTWARALGAAWLAFMQLVIWWAIVPSEWLNLTQGPLGWTSQDILFTIPPWIVLNNEISISLAVVKDVVAGTYHIISLAVVVLVALQIQKWGKVAPPPDTATAAPSPYGRPLRRGDR